MSNWTHVRGEIKIIASPYEVRESFKDVKPQEKDFATIEEYTKALNEYVHKKNEATYLPFPAEQFDLGPARFNRFQPEKPCLEFNAFIYSLPRARKYIEEAFKLLPEGELERIRHHVDQIKTDSNLSMNYCDVPYLKELYKETLVNRYKHDNPYYTYDFDDLQKYFYVNDHCSIDLVQDILIGIHDDLRYVSAREFKEALKKFIHYLESNDFDIEDGYIEWEDEAECDEDNIRYAWRKSKLDFDCEMRFMTLDATTNKIIEEEVYTFKKDSDGNIDFDSITNHDYDIIIKKYER